jgi:hypothetical protein
VPYDYYSIMHYESNAFALNPNIKTIIPLRRGVQLKRGKSLSIGDVYVIRKYYQCID